VGDQFGDRNDCFLISEHSPPRYSIALGLSRLDMRFYSYRIVAVPKPSLTKERNRIRFRQAMREVPPAALAIWVLLHERDLTQPTTAQALARAWGMTASSVGTAIAQLDRVGFIETAPGGTQKTLVTLKVRLDVSAGAFLRYGAGS
jgi:hypothetical protein